MSLTDRDRESFQVIGFMLFLLAIMALMTFFYHLDHDPCIEHNWNYVSEDIDKHYKTITYQCEGEKDD